MQATDMQAASSHSFAAAKPRAVFSVRKAIPSYTGPIFQLRQVFGDKVFTVIDKNGSLWTKCGQPLNDMLDHTAYMVDTWYDQSGNGNHAKQADKYIQPYLAKKKAGEFVVDFKYGRYLDIPNGTVPAASEPFSVVFKHGEITNPIGGVLGSGVYACGDGNANAIRRCRDKYVNYFWNNDLYTEPGSYKSGNVVSFVFSPNGKHTSGINGVPNKSRVAVQRFASPVNNTIGKTYGDNEYLNGELEFLYITEDVAKKWVSLETGEWKEADI